MLSRRTPDGRRRARHHSITIAQARDFEEAARFAALRGHGPTAFVTLNWAHAPSRRLPDSIDRLGAVRECMQKWLYRRRVPVVWLEVREHPRGDCDHAHWLVYVPRDHFSAFELAAARWVRQHADSFASSAVKVEPIYDLWGVVRYLLKGGDQEVRERFNCSRFRKPSQGVVYGPRIRVSHSIGKSARQAAAAGGAKALAA